MLYQVQTPDGAVHVEADAWQVDDSGCLGFFVGDRMSVNFWRDEWVGDEPGEVAAAPVNDNAPAPVEIPPADPAPVLSPPAA